MTMTHAAKAATMKKTPNTSSDSSLVAKVGGVPYQIDWLPWQLIADGTHHTDRCHGMTLFNDHKIRISHDNPKEKQTRTLVHELLHAIVEEYKIRELVSDGDHNEIAIDQLATGLCEALESLNITLPSKVNA